MSREIWEKKIIFSQKSKKSSILLHIHVAVSLKAIKKTGIVPV